MDEHIVRGRVNVSPVTQSFTRKGGADQADSRVANPVKLNGAWASGMANKNCRVRLIANKDTAMERPSSKHAAKPAHKGRPHSIKFKEHHDWLENKRPAYERASWKGKTAACAFITETTTAFLNEFGWSDAHFRSGRKKEQQGGDGQETDAGEADAVYKRARQKVYQVFCSSGSSNLAAQAMSPQWLMCSLLEKEKPIRRPKLINIFRRSPHYTAEMCAQFKKEWKTGLGEEDGAGDGKDDGGDDFAQDDGDNEDGEDAGSDSDDEETEDVDYGAPADVNYGALADVDYGALADMDYRALADENYTGESERLGDKMTQEEEEYWDRVMWPDDDDVSPKETWLTKVTKPWMVKRAGEIKGKKSWIEKHVQVIAEVVRSTKEGPPGMEGTFVYPDKLMDAFDAAAALEEIRGYEVRPDLLEISEFLTVFVKPAASESGSTYLDQLPENQQPDSWKLWKKARFPAMLPVAAEGQLQAEYGLQLIKYWIACQPKARLPQARRGGLEALATPEEAMDWSLLAARGPGGTFGFVRGLTIWAANIATLKHPWHWNQLAKDLRQVFLILALKERQRIAVLESPEGASGIHDVRGSASASSAGGQISALVSISARSASAQAQATARADSHGRAGLSAEDGGRRVRKESHKLQESKRHAKAIEASKKKRRKVTGDSAVPDVNHGHGWETRTVGEDTSEYGRGCGRGYGRGRGRGRGRGSESSRGSGTGTGTGRGRGRGSS
ncbi:hypothetical protein K488DRAFT_74966 [Vararia minispora EC-137]|uniref:Uncharacterized protein n=1 Tax=Vararia minispora EC-137 TaxID=1314806 RepID=A0ACB8Q5F8_9AGAM|nr:hypothetical protein K488DRAFT_74966 [Vararia minispora EC-137]